MAKKKKKGNPIIVGLVMLGASIGALWKNEHRFDYHKAAEKTLPVEDIASLARDELFSHSGTIDKGLTLEGYYVGSFSGYLEVSRSAEIYAWDRDEDDDGVTWKKKWMSSLEGNDRNQNLQQKLRSDRIHPATYEVDALVVEWEQIQFVDDREWIHPSSLQLTSQGTDQGLEILDNYFYLSKSSHTGTTGLGDERLSYRGLPVPGRATYFGKWGGEMAVAHRAVIKQGIISGIIADKGILHHLVAGDREAALLSIEAHLKRLKMIVRVVGLVVAAMGGGIFFSSLTRFLVFIPVVGSLVNRISGWLGMLLGFILGVTTLVLAFVTSQPVVLGVLLIGLAGAFYFLWKNAKQKRAGIQKHLTESLGHQPSQDELQELEFVKLYQLFASDGAISSREQKQLDQWASRHRWDEGKVASLILRAKDAASEISPKRNLESLIRFSLADGQISRSEMKSLEQAATKIGVGRLDLSSLIMQVQRV